MANTIQIKHGSGAPSAENLIPYELGYEHGGALYINNNGVITRLTDLGDYHRGVNLTQKFAGEIGNSDAWAWMKDRIANVDNGGLNGIHTGDYIPFVCKNGVTLKAQIAGINTYKNLGESNPVKNHIDFISHELWPESHQMNQVEWNNGFGSGGLAYPWRACDLYYWLNCLNGNVPGDTVNPPNTAIQSVDYRTTGVLKQLPDELVAAISEKMGYMPKRYDAASQATTDAAGAVVSVGKLWIPTEMEIFGTSVHGASGYGVCGGAQYPLFYTKEHIPKVISGTNERGIWWLASARNNSKTSFTAISKLGTGTQFTANTTGHYVPICFRISE